MPNQRNADRLKQKGTKSLAAWDFKSKDGPKEVPMAAFDNIPRQTEIMGQPHMLSYINPQEEAMLQKMRGGLPPVAGPGGVPAFWSWSDVFGGGSTTADTSSKDDDPPSNTFSQTLANIFTPSDGASYVGGQLVDDNTGSSISAGDTSSTGNVIAGTFANDSNNDDNTVTVTSGNTLSQIAEDNNMSVAEIMDANPDITNPDQIGIGQTLDLSGAGSGSDTYADGVGLGGIGSEPDDDPVVTTTPTFTSGGLEIRSLDSGTQYYVDEAGQFVGLVPDPDEFDPRGDQIISPTSNGAGVVTPATGYDDLDGALTNIPVTTTDSSTEFMMDDAVEQFYNQEDDTDYSLTSGDSRDDLSFDLTDPSEPLVTGNGVNFTGQYEGVTYVDGYPETAPLQVTIDESTYVPGQDTFESTFLANYGVPVPTSESAFMALPDGAKKDLALLPSDDMEDLLQTISTTSGDNSNVATTLINFGADLIGVRGVGDDPLYGVELTDNPANLLPPETETTPLNVELISTEDYEKLTNNETDSSVVGGYDEAGLNVGGLLNQDYTDLTDSNFQGLDLTEGGNTVGYATSGDNAGSAAIITPEGNIEIIGPGSTETGVVFTGETAVDDAIDYLTGDGEGEDGEESIDGTGTGTGEDGSGDGEGSGSGVGDGEGSGEGEGLGTGTGDGDGDDFEPEVIDPVDSYRVDNQFAVRDLVDDFNRRRKSGMGYGLPEYMRRYMSGQVIDELVRRVVLSDGSEFYVTPDGRYLDPKEFIGTAVVGDPTQMKIGEEQYQTGYTTTNLRTGEVTSYDKDGNPVAV